MRKKIHEKKCTKLCKKNAKNSEMHFPPAVFLFQCYWLVFQFHAIPGSLLILVSMKALPSTILLSRVVCSFENVDGKEVFPLFPISHS